MSEQLDQDSFLKEVKRHFEGVPFWNHLGCVIKEVHPSQASITLQIDSRHLNANATVHGGVHATLLDNVMGLAARTVCDGSVVTTNLNIHYLATENQGVLTTIGRVVHRTRSTVTTQAEVVNEAGAILSYATGSFRIIKKQESEPVFSADKNL